MATRISPEATNVVCVHRVNGLNVGDLASTPALYLRALRDATVIDALSLEHRIDELTDNTVIVGGGGLFGHPAFAAMWRALQSAHPRHLIVWGVGVNDYDSPDRLEDRFALSHRELATFDLVGVRDGDTSARWVPCISCLHPAFDALPQPTAPVVVFSHAQASLDHIAPDAPHLTNFGSDIARAIEFIANGETVLTNSYHGAYWALLAGRRVSLISPFSTKFEGLRRVWPIPQFGEHPFEVTEAARRGRSHPDALTQARAANAAFAADVARRTGIDCTTPSQLRAGITRSSIGFAR